LKLYVGRGVFGTYSNLIQESKHMYVYTAEFKTAISEQYSIPFYKIYDRFGWNPALNSSK